MHTCVAASGSDSRSASPLFLSMAFVERARRSGAGRIALALRAEVELMDAADETALSSRACAEWGRSDLKLNVWKIPEGWLWA